jgi:sortase (surface protein transpeptidase)
MCTLLRVRGGPILALFTCLIVLSGVAACSSTTPAAAPAPAAAAGPATPAPNGAAPAPSAAPQPPPAPAGPVTASPGDAALRLQALLGQHHVLAADLMRGRLRNDEDFAQAATAAVGQNTDELAEVIAGVAGEDQATRFMTLWNEHVTSLFTYARGLATNDPAVRDEARTALDRFRADGAEFIAEATSGRLTREAVRTELGTHDDHLMQQADAYAAGDYARANELYREGYQHAYALGSVLAANALPPDQAAELNTPAWKLRSEMTRLLGEHVGLALGTLRAGATNAPDFPAMAESLNGNTADVTAAVSSLFGDPAATQFMDLWADHLDLLGGYAADVGAGKENRREVVQAELHDWQGRFASFISTATDGRAAAPDLAAALLGLDDLLLGQVDALAAQDHQRARELANQTYPQVWGFARDLADAFGATLAARMPEGGAPTGGGGMAGALVPPAAGFPPAVSVPVPFRSVRTYQQVAPPVRLRIPALRIDTPLQQLGRAADRTVEAPTDFGVAGWFSGGPRPGQAGPAVILGHVDSRRGPGVFHPLAGVAPGSEVHVDRADGSTVTFRVTDVQTVAKDGFPTEQVYAPTLQSSLRLVTCGGPFDHAAGSYRDNVIVSADPVR